MSVLRLAVTFIKCYEVTHQCQTRIRTRIRTKEAEAVLNTAEIHSTLLQSPARDPVVTQSSRHLNLEEMPE